MFFVPKPENTRSFRGRRDDARVKRSIKVSKMLGLGYPGGP
jgi:hypothetical protein